MIVFNTSLVAKNMFIYLFIYFVSISSFESGNTEKK